MKDLIDQLPTILAGADSCNRYNGGIILLSLFVWIYWGIDTAEDKPTSRKSFLLLLVFPVFLTVLNIFTLMDPLCGELHPYAAFGVIASPILGALSFFIARSIQRRRLGSKKNQDLPPS